MQLGDDALPTRPGQRADGVYYTLYGRGCLSAIPFPELRGAAAVESRFRIEAGQVADASEQVWTERIVNEGGEEWLAVAVNDDTMWFRFLNALVCRSTRGGAGTFEIVVDVDARTPAETIRHFLIDEVIPTLLAMDGAIVLHGAAVVIAGGGVVILGESGAGKSTMALELGLSGVPVLADDCVVVDVDRNGVFVQPSYPSIRAWGDTAAHFLAGRPGTPFAHYSEKLRYSHGPQFAAEAVPLLGFVLLTRSSDHQGATCVEPRRGHLAGATVVRGAKSLPIGRRKTQAFATLLRLSEQVPVAEVRTTSGFAGVSRTRDALISWVERL
jgi:hypothetical protein